MLDVDLDAELDVDFDMQDISHPINHHHHYYYYNNGAINNSRSISSISSGGNATDCIPPPDLLNSRSSSSIISSSSNQHNASYQNGVQPNQAAHLIQYDESSVFHPSMFYPNITQDLADLSMAYEADGLSSTSSPPNQPHHTPPLLPIQSPLSFPPHLMNYGNNYNSSNRSNSSSSGGSSYDNDCNLNHYSSDHPHDISGPNSAEEEVVVVTAAEAAAAAAVEAAQMTLLSPFKPEWNQDELQTIQLSNNNNCGGGYYGNNYQVFGQSIPPPDHNTCFDPSSLMMNIHSTCDPIAFQDIMPSQLYSYAPLDLTTAFR
ncbi:hypothetical protein J3Q64DRAFT_1713230 [Phycomyces blakesleeanus]|uniref:Uncharacterized protein n=1 Tax=Phycomyces blakesleeanus TaxID=4837 RepID=A0ABR3BEY1_PHYBL